MQRLTPEFRDVLTALNVVLAEDAKSYGWFSSPVDAEKVGLQDYHAVVKTPMDLGTVYQRILSTSSASNSSVKPRRESGHFSC